MFVYLWLASNVRWIDLGSLWAKSELGSFLIHPWMSFPLFT